MIPNDKVSLLLRLKPRGEERKKRNYKQVLLGACTLWSTMVLFILRAVGVLSSGRSSVSVSKKLRCTPIQAAPSPPPVTRTELGLPKSHRWKPPVGSWARPASETRWGRQTRGSRRRERGAFRRAGVSWDTWRSSREVEFLKVWALHTWTILSGCGCPDYSTRLHES